ncbi:MAG: acyl carrier protein [Gammaproteobacteria bacterium]|nr:acyl carrier protein [Gammaproteobacteria bacterium]
MARSYDDILTRLIRHLERFAGPDVAIDEDVELVTELGLDSVKVLDVILEIEDEFDVSVPMNLLADVRTVRDLATVIHQILTSPAESRP